MAYLPPPLMTSEPGSFARHTIEQRKPEIIDQVLADLRGRPTLEAALLALKQEIRYGQIAPPPEDVPLRDAWHTAWQQWRGRTWLEVPWYFAESYFYLRLLAAIGYFTGDAQDPFKKRKRTLLEHSKTVLSALAEARRVSEHLPRHEAFALLARRSLWGNRLDLSNEAIMRRHLHDSSRLQDTTLLVENSEEAYDVILSSMQRPVIFIADNSGPELLADLLLAAWLLEKGVRTVVFELKCQPFFVSDAMIEDAKGAIDYLQTSKVTEMRDVGNQLQNALDEEHLVLRDHPAWTGPDHYTSLPQDLMHRLSQASLVISKGDVNYRRFLEDRHWPFSTPIEDVIDYFPAPLLLLRTMKGELACGLDRTIVEQLNATEPDWLISGVHGVAHYVAARP